MAGVTKYRLRCINPPGPPLIGMPASLAAKHQATGAVINTSPQLLMPQPKANRRPQILIGAAANPGDITSQALAEQYAARYDIISHINYGNLDWLDELRAANPNIILGRYRYPHATQSETKYDGAGYKAIYPGDWYMKDIVNGLKISGTSTPDWRWLDIRVPEIRAKLVDEIYYEVVEDGEAPLDHLFMDISAPLIYNQASGGPYRSDGTSPPDVGDMDGSYAPPTSKTQRPYSQDGTFCAAMLAFFDEIQAHLGPTRTIIYNGYLAEGDYNADYGPYWRGKQSEFIGHTHGVCKEAIFVNGGNMISIWGEWRWNFWKARVLEVAALGKIFEVWATGNFYTLPPHKYNFGSYLMVADERYIWFRIPDYMYSSGQGIYDLDYGAPQGPAVAIPATPSGNIHKRTFANGSVWINPSPDTTRTADGRTLSPYEVESDVAGWPAG